MNRLHGTWRSLDAPGRYYWIAKRLLILPLGGLLLIRSPQSPAFVLLSLPSLFLLAAGFLTWAIPKVAGRAVPRLGVWTLVGIHAMLAPFCIGLARMAVASALGLPPQFFDLTVTLLAVLLVPLAWVFLISVLSMAGILAGFITWFVADRLAGAIEFFRRLACLESSRTMQWRTRLSRAFDHGVGFFVTLSIVLALSSSYESTLRKQDLVRLAAFVLDFNVANNYPGAKPGLPMRLLDNGKVAYARRKGWDVQIEIESLDPDPR